MVKHIKQAALLLSISLLSILSIPAHAQDQEHGDFESRKVLFSLHSQKRTLLWLRLHRRSISLGRRPAGNKNRGVTLYITKEKNESLNQNTDALHPRFGNVILRDCKRIEDRWEGWS